MKALKSVFGAVAMVVAMVGSAQAIDLVNEDGANHKVRITSSTMSREIDLKSMTLSLVVCVGECTFEVAGVGRVKASKNDVVIIRDGKVSIAPGKEPASAAK